MFKLGAFTDEIHQDLERALDVMKELGMGYAEIRSAWGKNVSAFLPEDLKRVKEVIDGKGFMVSAIAGPFFKCDLPGRGKGQAPRGDTHLAEERDYSREMEVLNRCIEAACALGSNIVRTFAFWREEPVTDELLSEIAGYFQRPLEMARDAGVKLALENEFACCVGDGEETGRFLSILKQTYPELYDYIGVIWDPGNAFFLDEVPFPDGYRYIPADKIIHVHLKDARKNPATGKPEWAPIGGGDVDFRGNLKALKEAGYSGVLSLETHFKREGQTPEEASRESFQGLQDILKGL